MRLLKELMILGILAASAPSAHALLAGNPNGTPADTPQLRVDANVASSPWAGVGSIVIGSQTFTGTLIDSRHVLTAAHVVYGAQLENIRFNLNANGDLSSQFNASAVHVNPRYNGFIPGADGIVHDDLAVIELSEAVSDAVPVYSLYSQPLSQAASLTFVGYGASGNGVDGITVGSSSTVKRVGQNTADILLHDIDGNDQADAFLFDFDGGNSNAFGGTSLGNGIETTFGVGDSGAPAFIRVNDAWQLAGVGTFVAGLGGRWLPAGTFGTGGGGMIVSAYTSWIQSTVSPVPEVNISFMLVAGLVLVAGVALRRQR
ncbi:MAG: S1 family peptidase [Methylophilaceae bacterium]